MSLRDYLLGLVEGLDHFRQLLLSLPLACPSGLSAWLVGVLPPWDVQDRVGSWFSNPTGAPTPTEEGRAGGVGKYLKKGPDAIAAGAGAGAGAAGGVSVSGTKRAAPEGGGGLGLGGRPAKVGGSSGKGYGNFDAW